MSFWTACRLQPGHEHYGLHCLGVLGYAVYFPRLRVRRVSGGRKIESAPPLFPGYAFVTIERQWYAARWCPGTLGLVMSGGFPVRVADAVIEEIRSRERGGLVHLPKLPEPRPGSRIRILRGPLQGHLGLYEGMRPRERVMVLLALLGSQQRVSLAQRDIEVLK
jgi:transcription antitermination factor NusG